MFDDEDKHYYTLISPRQIILTPCSETQKVKDRNQTFNISLLLVIQHI